MWTLALARPALPVHPSTCVRYPLRCSLTRRRRAIRSHIHIIPNPSPHPLIHPSTPLRPPANCFFSSSGLLTFATPQPSSQTRCASVRLYQQTDITVRGHPPARRIQPSSSQPARTSITTCDSGRCHHHRAANYLAPPPTWQRRRRPDALEARQISGPNLHAAAPHRTGRQRVSHSTT